VNKEDAETRLRKFSEVREAEGGVVVGLGSRSAAAF